MKLYKPTLTRSAALHLFPDLIWPEVFDMDAEIEKFPEIWQNWRATHPNGYNKDKQATDFIAMLLKHHEELEKISKETGWPYAWCIDAEHNEGQFFNPEYVLFGDSRFFDISNDQLTLVDLDREKKKGAKAKKGTKLNNRFRIKNKYYHKTGHINIERFIANYFRKRPKDGEYHAGHIFGYKTTLDTITNSNMFNVYWQRPNDNSSKQVLFDHGKGAMVLAEDAGDVPIELDSLTDNMLKAVKDKRLTVGYYFKRNPETDAIDRVLMLQSRHIKPIN